jgi:hypothetical protein
VWEKNPLKFFKYKKIMDSTSNSSYSSYYSGTESDNSGMQEEGALVPSIITLASLKRKLPDCTVFGSLTVTTASSTPYTDATKCKKLVKHVKRPMNGELQCGNQGTLDDDKSLGRSCCFVLCFAHNNCSNGLCVLLLGWLISHREAAQIANLASLFPLMSQPRQGLSLWSRSSN